MSQLPRFSSNALSIGLFISSCALTAFTSRIRQKITKRFIKNVVLRLEQRIQRDEGGRGIKDILPAAGALLEASVALSTCSTIAIITGFPCLLDFDVPTETDGPPGACAIAKALLLTGKTVIILTDECNEEAVLACASAMRLTADQIGRLQLESFPPAMDRKELDRLMAIRDSIDAVVAIERAGPNKEQKYLTMRARDMSHLVAPLDTLLLSGSEDDLSANRRMISVAIGDGGNEVGMGKVYDRVIKSANIPNAATIACVVPADHLIVASVSNWGGYALAGAIGLVQCANRKEIANFEMSNSAIQSTLTQFLPSAAEETDKLKRMIEVGARDGVTKERALMVDGMDLQVSLDLIDEMSRM